MSSPVQEHHYSEDRKENLSSAGSTVEGHGSNETKQVGVLTAEAASTIVGWKIWAIYIGIALTAYVYGLDNNTMYAYLQAATMNLGKFPLYTTISVIQQVLIGVAKFPIAKLSDVFGRAQGYLISLACYIVGFIIVASSQRFSDICGGVVLYAIGNSGVQIMQQIVIADAVSTKYRGLAIGLVSLPYLVNFAVAGKITGALVEYTPDGLGIASDKWRWGPGMFCIIMPVALAPVVLGLAVSQRQAKKIGEAPRHPYREMPALRAISAFCRDIDLGGLFLICAGFLLILLPLQLHSTAPNGWSTDYIIAMLVVGGVLLISTGFYEWLLASDPILKRRFVFNKDVIFPTIIGFFDFFSFYVSWVSVYQFVVILKGWSISDATYFSNAQSLCLTVFGIAIGAVNLATRRFKWSMVTGTLIRILGMGLMIKYRNADSSTAQLVIPQVLQGLGGGILGITLQVAAQIAVPHQDVAIVTAFVLLATEIGGAVGTAVLGAVQISVIPNRLLRYLPGDQYAAARSSMYLMPAPATITYPLGTPERDAFIHAWSDYMHILLIIAISFSAIPVILACFISDRELGNTQNCVNNEPTLHVGRSRSEEKTHHQGQELIA
ncbi:unnamed protein product [Sympodiomycopsis kandeliae]